MIGPDSSFILLKNGLPKVTIFSTKQGSSYGNKIEIYGGEIIFKPTITCKMEYSITGTLELYRSTSQNGTYTKLELPRGAYGTNVTYNSLTSSYYYKASGGGQPFYLKDTAGSAVQFVE